MGIAADALGEDDADQNRRDFQDRHEQWHVALKGNLVGQQKGDHHGEGTGTDRPVVCRDAG